MEVDLEKLLNDLKRDIRNLSRKSAAEHLGEFAADDRYLNEFLSMHLKRWVSDLQAGTLSRDDFEYHIKSKVDLMSLVKLKRRGLVNVRLDKFRHDISQLLVTAILKAAGI